MASETKALRYGPTPEQVEAVRRAAKLDRLGHPSQLRHAIEDVATAALQYGLARTPPPADAEREALITALGEIATYPRPSRTPGDHMADTIENMRAIARAALAREGETK